MNTKSRIASILNSESLETSVTGLPTFELSSMIIDEDLDFPLPSNLRLGHLAEKIVSELLKSSSNYNVLYENIQLSEDKQTIGEIDFIVEGIPDKRVIHMELAYKFYLYDPSIAQEPIKNWIGPNRNDSLIEKLEKLKSKQFPLLHHPAAVALFHDLEIDSVSQELCLLASLFIPYQYEGTFDPEYQRAIKGYYMNLETFLRSDRQGNEYYIPSKSEWGMDPSQHEEWSDLNSQKAYIASIIEERQSLLCWQKHGDNYLTFFIVWW